MIIVKKYLLLLMLASVFSQQAHAYEVYEGSGAKSCATYLKDLKDTKRGSGQEMPPAYLNSSWVTWFVTATNWHGIRTKRVNANDMDAFITEYCNENPSDVVHDAALALVYKLEIK